MSKSKKKTHLVNKNSRQKQEYNKWVRQPLGPTEGSTFPMQNEEIHNTTDDYYSFVSYGNGACSRNVTYRSNKRRKNKGISPFLSGLISGILIMFATLYFTGRSNRIDKNTEQIIEIKEMLSSVQTRLDFVVKNVDVIIADSSEFNLIQYRISEIEKELEKSQKSVKSFENEIKEIEKRIDGLLYEGLPTT